MTSRHFDQLQLFDPSSLPEPEPWDQRPDAWQRRPDVWYHGTQNEQWPKAVSPSSRVDEESQMGTRHFGTYQSAFDRLSGLMASQKRSFEMTGSSGDPRGYVHARRIPEEDLDQEEVHGDPDQGDFTDWGDWAGEFGHYVPKPAWQDPDDDPEPESALWDDDDGYVDDGQRKVHRETAINTVGRGVRYTNDVEDPGSISVEVPPQVPRTWAQDVADQYQFANDNPGAPTPHPNYVDAALRAERYPREEWRFPSTYPKVEQPPLSVLTGGRPTFGYSHPEPPVQRIDPLLDPEERGQAEHPAVRLADRDRDRVATFNNEVNIRR